MASSVVAKNQRDGCVDSLIIENGKTPVTDQGQVGCVMQIRSGEGADTQWFDYRPSFKQPVVRVEWDKDTMDVVLPADVSEYLFKHGYARPMADAEAEAYNAALARETEPAEPEPPAAPQKETRKLKKGDQQ